MTTIVDINNNNNNNQNDIASSNNDNTDIINSVNNMTTTSTNMTTTTTTRIRTTWTATVTKETDNSLVGISFSGDGTEASPVLIASINPNGLVGQTAGGGGGGGNLLHVGLRVQSINGYSVWTGCSANMLAQMVRTSTAGELTIVAKGVVATCPITTEAVTMMTNNNNNGRRGRVGISLKKDFSLNAIVVGRILPDSIVANKGIQPGQRLTRINGMPCPSTTRGAIELILNSEGVLTLVTVDLSSDTTTTTTSRNNPEEDALSMAMSSLFGGSVVSTPGGSNPNIVIDNLNNNTGLVMHDNDLDQQQEQAPMLQHLPVTSSTQLTDSSSSSIHHRWLIRTEKANKNAKIGIALKKDQATSVIYVHFIAPTSIFQGTHLRRGHVVTKINDCKCPTETRAAVRILQNIESTVWLEVLERPELMDN